MMEMTLDPPVDGIDGKSRRRRSSRRKSESAEQLLGEPSSRHHHHHRSHRHRDETPEERAARKLRKSLEASSKVLDQNGELDLAASKSQRKSKRTSKDPTASTALSGQVAGEGNGTEEQKHRRRKHRSHPEGSTSELQSPKHRHSHHGHHHKRKSSSASKSKHREERDRDEKRSERHSKSEKTVINEYSEYYQQQQGITNDPGYREFERIEPQNIPDSEMYDAGHSYRRDQSTGRMDYTSSGGVDDSLGPSPNHRIGRIFSERAIPIHIPEGPKQPTTPPRNHNTVAAGDLSRSLPTPGVIPPLTPLMSPLQRRAAVRRKRLNELDTVGMGVQRLYFDDSDEPQAGGNTGSTLQPQIWSDDGGSISPQISPYMSTEFPNLRNSRTPEPRPDNRATPDVKPLPLSCRLPMVLPETKCSPFGGPLQITSIPSRPPALGNPFNPGNGNNARGNSGNEFHSISVPQAIKPSISPYMKPSTSPAPPPLPPKPFMLPTSPPPIPPQNAEYQSHHQPSAYSQYNPIVSPPSFVAPMAAVGTGSGGSGVGGLFSRKVEHLEAKAMNKLHKVRGSTRHSSR